jgi:3-hydroxybutyryl-CoA dehydrogenase
MHFFNPAPLMRLVEVVAGADSAEWALAAARAAGEAMGKVVIDAVDGPGFLVNRCNRPFGLEALKLLTERVAPLEQIDRICRLGGGFRMGPFELMDLVGVDTGLDVSRSFYEQSYDYSAEEYRPADPDPLPAGGGDGMVVIAGHSPLAFELVAAAAAAGWEVATPADAIDREPPVLILDLTLDGEEVDAPLQGAPQAICCAGGSLGALDPGGAAVGFHALPPFDQASVVELCRAHDTAGAAAQAAERFFASLGKRAEWVADAPGLVLGRIVCQVVNEAAFALGEGVGSAEDIDAGMVHGLNYPRGILGWADAIGLDHVLAVLLALVDERREERYRPAPALLQRVWSGRLGHQTGAGFFEYRE